MALLPWLGVSKWFPSLQPSMSEEPWIFLSAVWAAFYWPNHLANCCLQLNPSRCTKVNLFPAHKIWPPQLARGELLLFMLPSWDLRAKATLWAWEVAPSWNESATMLCFRPRHKAPTRLPCLYSGSFLPCCPARSVNRDAFLPARCFGLLSRSLAHLTVTQSAPFCSDLKRFVSSSSIISKGPRSDWGASHCSWAETTFRDSFMCLAKTYWQVEVFPVELKRELVEKAVGQE